MGKKITGKMFRILRIIKKYITCEFWPAGKLERPILEKNNELGSHGLYTFNTF